MTREEKFLKFIDERIKNSSSNETRSAYVIVKEKFKKLFDKEKPKTDLGYRNEGMGAGYPM